MGQPGEKIDLSTFIAYLLPGFLIESMIFLVIDSISLITTQSSLLVNILIIDSAKLIIIGTFLLLVAYFWGLVLDLYAHASTGQYEEKIKSESYHEVFLDTHQTIEGIYRKLLNNDDKAKSNTFVDVMFYQYATPVHWARQNWSWAFYEASRNLVILFLPLLFFLSFYGTTIIAMKYLKLDTLLIISLSSFVSITISIIAWRLPYRKLKEYRDVMCRVYHRHRMFVVAGYLIDRTLHQIKEKPDVELPLDS